jgi:class 3 adenylate cyclase
VVEPSDVRIGDQDRQEVIDALSRHTGQGRLTLDEFSDLVGRVYAARTRRDLDELLSDLPPEPEAAGPATPEPVDQQVGSRRRFVAVMCGTRARGRWRAPRRVTGFAFWGHAKVDLREAVIEEPVVDVTAWAIMGGVEVVVPDGIRVELDGLVLMGGSHNRVNSTTEPAANAPRVRVHARGLWGGVVARTGRRRSRSGERRRQLHRHDLDDHIEDLRDIARDALRSLHAAFPPPPPPAFAPRPRHPSFPGTHGWPLDVRERSNGRRATSLPRGTMTILVTDMVGSTALAEELGDRKWWEILQAHNVLVRAEVERHGGIEVKAQGDGFLVVFASAREAILAAVDIQRAAARYRAENPSRPIELRIGLHTGETVESDGDVFGQNVILAVRIADAASPGDVLVSGLTHDLTAAGGDLRFGPGEEVSLKGFSVPWRVHRVAWA